MENDWKGGLAMSTETPTRRRRRRGRSKLRIWNGFVMIVGYAALLYGLARGVVYVLVLLGGGA